MCFIYNLMPFIPSFLAGKIFLKCDGVRRLSQVNLIIGNWVLDESCFPGSLDKSQLKQGCRFMMISWQNTATISDVGKRREATCGDSIQQREKQLEDCLKGNWQGRKPAKAISAATVGGKWLPLLLLLFLNSGLLFLTLNLQPISEAERGHPEVRICN